MLHFSKFCLHLYAFRYALLCWSQIRLNITMHMHAFFFNFIDTSCAISSDSGHISIPPSLIHTVFINFLTASIYFPGIKFSLFLSLFCIIFTISIFMLSLLHCGPGSSVSIATDYRLDGPGSNPVGDEIFCPSRPALGPTQPPVKYGPRLSWGVNCGRGVLMTTHPLLVRRSRKSSAIPHPPDGPR